MPIVGLQIRRQCERSLRTKDRRGLYLFQGSPEAVQLQYNIVDQIENGGRQVPEEAKASSNDLPKKIILDVAETDKPLKAMRLHCLLCPGGSSSAVKECVNSTCAKFPFRFGKNPNRTRNLSKAERAEIAGQLRRGRECAEETVIGKDRNEEPLVYNQSQLDQWLLDRVRQNTSQQGG